MAFLWAGPCPCVRIWRRRGGQDGRGWRALWFCCVWNRAPHSQSALHGVLSAPGWSSPPLLWAPAALYLRPHPCLYLFELHLPLWTKTRIWLISMLTSWNSCFANRWSINIYRGMPNILVYLKRKWLWYYSRGKNEKGEEKRAKMSLVSLGNWEGWAMGMSSALVAATIVCVFEISQKNGKKKKKATNISFQKIEQHG